jgi:hypothetical protein
MPPSRRDFAKLTAMGLAAHYLPSALAQEAAPRRIGYAVIGLGRIATHFLAGTAQSEHSKITALVSGHRDKAERIAAQYNVPTSSIYDYKNFDSIAANPAVDAVYVVPSPTACTPSTPSAPPAPASTSSARSPWTSPPPSAAA